LADDTDADTETETLLSVAIVFGQQDGGVVMFVVVVVVFVSVCTWLKNVTRNAHQILFISLFFLSCTQILQKSSTNVQKTGNCVA